MPRIHHCFSLPQLSQLPVITLYSVDVKFAQQLTLFMLTSGVLYVVRMEILCAHSNKPLAPSPL